MKGFVKDRSFCFAVPGCFSFTVGPVWDKDCKHWKIQCVVFSNDCRPWMV